MHLYIVLDCAYFLILKEFNIFLISFEVFEGF